MTGDLFRHSVTSNDRSVGQTGGPVTVVIGPADLRWGGLLEHVRGATGLPAYGSRERDQILAGSPLVEDMWAGAVSIAISRQVAIGWRIEDDAQSSTRLRRAHELLRRFDGAYASGIQRHLRDYLLTNNGAFVEIVRASSARGSRVLGLMHLDSLRCWRTGDPAWPVIYQSLRGTYHRIPAENVLMFADLPSARAADAGYGHCAADRAWATIIKRAGVETYLREKITGTRNLALHFITGVNADRLQAALAGSEADQANRGYVLYRGSTIVPMLAGAGETPTLITIPLAEIPDGFDPGQERRAANQIYANAIGIPVQDIEPLSGQGLGTGTQSVILAEAGAGQGLASWRRAWLQAINHSRLVLPGSTTFYFENLNDVRDRQARANALATVATAVGNLVERGILRPDQALSVLVDEGVLDPAYLPAPQIAGALVGDTDKPRDEPAEPEEPEVAEEHKTARDDLDRLIDAEHDAALAWARQVVADG